MKISRRIDQLLVERGAFSSRSRAQGAIRAGLVTVDGAAVEKPSATIPEDCAIDVAGDVHDYVSRGALKLERGLLAYDIDPAGKTCLDLGASTGGFTEVLLRRGARKVYAVDVGTGQLHPKLTGDPRIVNLEKTHAKDLTREAVPEEIDLIVCDVSFISLRKALPFAMALAAPRAFLVALIKPQFEIGRSHIGKGGVVNATDAALGALASEIVAWTEAQGWKSAGVIESPIEGGDGNKEFLIGATRSA